MSTADASSGGGAPGPGGGGVGGSGGGGGGGSNAGIPGGGSVGGTTGGTQLNSSSGVNATNVATGEALKIIKTQLLPHHYQQQHHAMNSPNTLPTHKLSSIQIPIVSVATSATAYHQQPSYTSSSMSTSHNPEYLHSVHSTHLTTNSTQMHSHSNAFPHFNSPLQLIKSPYTYPNTFSFNPVAAKITHVKTSVDNSGGGAIGNNSSLTIGGVANNANVVGAGGNTIMTSGVSTTGAIKVATGGSGVTTSLVGPIALNVAQSSATPTAIRTIGAGGQSTQVRVVMPTSIIPIKQFENSTGAGRTQITAIPSAASRTVSNTSITVTRPVTQATYLPRAGVTATQMTGVATGQRLVTPIRASPAAGVATGATVSGLTTATNFVRGATVSRSSISPATTVISPVTSTTWMQTNTGQVQLIRTIPQQSQKRIITAQGIANATGSNSAGATVSGAVVATTPPTVMQAAGVQSSNQTVGQNNQSTIQAVSSQAAQQPHSQQQQTYVATLATVLPPRQHQATLVYSSNVATTQPLSQPQQFNPAIATGQRFAVATQLTTGNTTGTAPRQIRPIPLGKSFSTTKLNTTSISIRAPNIPQLSSTLTTGGVSSSAMATANAVAAAAVATNSPRSTTITGVTSSTGNVIPTTNLPTTRIIQLQQQPGGTAQQLTGATGRLPGNLMFQPIIVNTSGTGKIGIRQPLPSMTAKVQPSLTITPFGLGKLPAAASAAGASIGVGQQQSIQTIGSTGTATGSCGNASPSISSTTPTSASVSGTNLSAATAQLVNVSQAAAATGQILTTQNIVSSAGGATVVPLAISTRGGASGNILTGTITPLKNASGITVGKVMAQAQVASSANIANVSDGNNVSVNSSGNTGAGVYIHQAAATQRQHSTSNTSIVTGGSSSLPAVSGANSNNVLSSAGGIVPTSAGAFLPPGGTIYYESVPASSVQVSTGVLSLTTTTVTSSTISAQNQIASSTSNLSISTLPFATSHAANSAATFAMVPSTGGRTIGQLQIPVSSTGAQIQALPVRFSAQLTAAPSGNASTSTDPISVSQATHQLMQSTVSSTGQQILIPAAHQSAATATLTGPQGQHVVIPLQTSNKVAASASTGTAVVTNFLRKRDADGSPIRAAKNLGPTLLSMGSSIASTTGSPAASSVGSSFSVTSTASSSNTANALTAEALAKKDRSAAVITGTVLRPQRADSPASSDGSTTVSANSSPGVEQQMQDSNMVINHMPQGTSDATHFNPINDMYPNHHGSISVSMHHNALASTGTPVSSRNSSLDHHQQMHTIVVANTVRMNGVPIECPARKKSRRSTNDSQLSGQSQASLTLPPPIAAVVGYNNNMNPDSGAIDAAISNGMPIVGGAGTVPVGHDGNANIASTHNMNHKNNNMPPTIGNKENAKPVEFILRRPRNFTLINTYKQNWKAATNHFQRYSDVKPREERRPTVIDLANQANVLGKINGWKVYHLRSQMEDLCENESHGYDKLCNMLKQMETHEKNPEIERISELLKGNMQRSKIIIDGINEAQNQIMKIFEHKSHISDIIHRCASKRNFKKREKF